MSHTPVKPEYTEIACVSSRMSGKETSEKRTFILSWRKIDEDKLKDYATVVA